VIARAGGIFDAFQLEAVLLHRIQSEEICLSADR
jgi:hypothetical protein